MGTDHLIELAVPDPVPCPVFNTFPRAFGQAETSDIVFGRTDRVALDVAPPADAVMVTFIAAVTAKVGMLNVALVLP